MHRKALTLTVFCAAFVVAPLASLAAPVTVPTGLLPGDQYRLAFVTSTTRDGTSDNVEDYNSFVTAAANAVPELLALGTSWKAIASTEDDDARDNTGTNPGVSTGVPIYNLVDDLLADDNSDLWDGVLYVVLRDTEIGTAYSDYETGVWTGTTTSGVKAPKELGDTATPYAMTGNFTDDEDYWVEYANESQTSMSNPVYALSGILTVEAPEPGTMVLAFTGTAILVISSLRRNRRRKA